MTDDTSRLFAALRERFGDAADGGETPGAAALLAMAAHRSQRRYTEKPVDPALLRTLCAVALASPSKSDMQQRDIVVVEKPAVRSAIADLVPSDPWVRAAPAFLVFCGNNRRQRQLHEWRQKPFANDHLDPFFNAAVDAGIALAWFVAAAEAAGLGTCPISQIRNHAQAISDLLGLPEFVFPVAGMCVGWPSEEGAIVPRLPLAATVHTDRFDDKDVRRLVETYDKRRRYRTQRDPERFGTAAEYGWSEDKARQYAKSERADFGAYVRRRGFRLD